MPPTDYEQIQNHLARYCHIVDRDGVDAIAALFWDDATLEFDGTFNGIAEIRGCYSQWIEKMRDPVVGLRHLIHSPSIEILDAEAAAECYFDADCHIRANDRPIQLRGIYKDRLAKRNGEWRFLERQIILYKSAL